MRILKQLYKKFREKIQFFEKKAIIISLCVIFVLSLGMTLYTGIKTSYINYMTVTLNYEGAKEGLNPDGSRFNIAEIKSDEVLKSAINKLGDNSISVEDVKDRVSIDSKMPRSAIEKTTSAIASGTNYRYNPSEFNIYYSQKKKLGKNNTVEFLNSLSAAYKDYFFNQYAEKNTIFEFEADEEFENYDYYEKKRVLTDKINSMIGYLGKHQEENPTFKASSTGYSFENLISMLINLRDRDIEKLGAYIVQNSVSDNNDEFVRKQQFLMEKISTRYKSNLQSAEITRAALELYDPYITGIAFIPSVDGNDEYYMSRTKTGLDNLAVKSYNYGVTANDLKKKSDEHEYLATKFSVPSENESADNITAETMIDEACEYLEKISSVAVMTDDEYVSYKTKDYITFNLPKEKNLLSVKVFVKYFAMLLILLVLAVLVYKPIVRFAKEKYFKAAEFIEEKLKLKTEDE